MHRYLLLLVLLNSCTQKTEVRDKLQEETQPAAGQIVLRNIRIFDGDSGTMTEPRDVVIVEDRIESVEAASAENSPRPGEIDCTGKFAVAGMFDCHTHLCWLKAHPPDVYEGVLKAFVLNGFTQIRDVGGPLDVLREMKQKIDTGEILGPEIFYTGPLLEKSPLTWGENNKVFPEGTIAIDSKEDADRVIQKLVEGGACMVKTFNKFDLEVYRHILDLAAKHKLRVVHDPGAFLFHRIPMDGAIDLGVTSIEHAKAPLPVILKDEFKKQHDELLKLEEGHPDQEAFKEKVLKAGENAFSMAKLDKLIDKMIERNVCFCPTLIAFAKTIPQTVVQQMPEEKRAATLEKIAFMDRMGSQFTREMARRKVKLLVGQDMFSPTGTLEEMMQMQKIGVPASAILQGATIHPARWLGVDDRLGAIAPGRMANLVVLEKNPLDDIDHLTTQWLVFHHGRIAYDNRKPAAPGNQKADPPGSSATSRTQGMQPGS